MRQLGVLRNSTEVFCVHANQTRDALAVENLANDVEVCAQRHAEQVCLVA